MINTQHNSDILKDTVDYIDHWSHDKSLSARSTFVLMVSVIAIIFAGGLFFWLSQFNPLFATRVHSRQSELEVARSGLHTMKRMVGDQTAWSQTIKEEYNKIMMKEHYADYGYNNSFSAANNSPGQLPTRQ